jgi:hypothetical protein
MTTDSTARSVARFWGEHVRSDFPARLRGEEVAGVDMVMLDGDIAGCVSTWLASASCLDERRWEILARCMTDLDRVLDQLAGDEEHYYRRLQQMTGLVLGKRTGER